MEMAIPTIYITISGCGALQDHATYFFPIVFIQCNMEPAAEVWPIEYVVSPPEFQSISF